ncbi:hypothetical protein BV25DRAFT_302708 [Artomyces pyxidatus]|uniref:Uncharacterized protein n=1 Tax=Artomyces pyxidatus TaxID=48021 RepID=A0ACB8T6Z8_9AGAM|nr:hypothetical protein BV25DRAFT_302708 [Artomyces pyxidatus]
MTLPQLTPTVLAEQRSSGVIEFLPTVINAIQSMVNLRVLEIYSGVFLENTTSPFRQTLDSNNMDVLCRILQCRISLDLFAVHNLEVVPRTKVAKALEHPIWASLGHRATFTGAYDYNPHAAGTGSLLSFHHALQILDLHNGVCGRPQLVYHIAECRFPALRDLSIAGWSPLNGYHAVQFLHAHPTIHRLVWRGEFPHTIQDDLPEGFLPHLKHLKADSWTIPEALLGRQQGPRALETLDCRDRTRSDSETLPRISRGRVLSVRRLTVICTDVAALRGLATIFPSVTHLRVSGRLPVDRARGLLVHNAISSGASKSFLDTSPPTIEHALAYFPQLEVLGAMTFHDSMEMRIVLAKYPQLHYFEEPQFRF